MTRATESLLRGTRRGCTARIALGLAVLMSISAHPALARGSRVSQVAASPVPARRAYSVKDSPGYIPLVDPESSSVALGRRLNAPLVSMPFTGGARSREGLALAIVRALHRLDRDSLSALCITDSEFREILWREFPQSRPVTGVQWDDAWKILNARLHAGCMHALRDHGGHVYQLQSVRADSVATYRNFTLHSGVHLIVRDDEGRTQDWRWVRGIVERKGRFKIYSTED